MSVDFDKFLCSKPDVVFVPSKSGSALSGVHLSHLFLCYSLSLSLPLSFTRCDPIHPQEFDHQENQGTVEESSPTDSLSTMLLCPVLYYDTPSSTKLHRTILILLSLALKLHVQEHVCKYVSTCGL